MLTINLKQKMDDLDTGFILGIAACAVVVVLPIALNVTPANTAYTKGITDCRSGKVSYAVTVGPEGVDTTYTYKP
jgi:hypothetical protein